MLATLYSQRHFDLLDMGVPALILSALVLLLLLAWLSRRRAGLVLCSLPVISGIYFLCGVILAHFADEIEIIVLSSILTVVVFLSGLFIVARIPLGLEQDKAPWPKT